MKIDAGFQAVLRVGLRNSRGSDFGISGGRDEIGVRWHDIRTKFHKDWFRHSKVSREGYMHRQEGDLISLLFIFSK
jgi:hypothetical protein